VEEEKEKMGRWEDYEVGEREGEGESSSLRVILRQDCVKSSKRHSRRRLASGLARYTHRPGAPSNKQRLKLVSASSVNKVEKRREDRDNTIQTYIHTYIHAHTYIQESITYAYPHHAMYALIPLALS